MPRSPVSFRQADVKRAVSGAEAAGMKVSRVEIDPETGKIVLLTGTHSITTKPVNELDRWLEDNNGA